MMNQTTSKNDKIRMTRAYPIAIRRNSPLGRVERISCCGGRTSPLVPRILEPLLEGARLDRWRAQIFFDRRQSFLDSSHSDPKAIQVIGVGQRGVLFIFFGDGVSFSD